MIGTASWAVAIAIFALLMFSYLWRAAHHSQAKEALRRRLGGGVHGADSLLRSDENVEGLAKLLAESGLGWSQGLFARNVAAAAFAGLIAGGAIGGPTVGILLALLGAAIVPVYLRQARNKRLALCDAQMPQALEIMSLALRAGHPLPGALRVAVSEAPSPICDELRRCQEEHELGRQMGEVLLSLGKRLSTCASVQTFVVAVLVLEQTGGNLIAVIERIVENARARSQYLSKLRALTSEGRSSARIMSILPGGFMLLVTMVDPSYFNRLLKDPAGMTVLGIVGGLWLIGVLWTRHLTRMEG